MRLLSVMLVLLSASASAQVFVHTNDVNAPDPLAHPITIQSGAPLRYTISPNNAGAPMSVAGMTGQWTIVDREDGATVATYTGAPSGEFSFRFSGSVGGGLRVGRSYEGRAIVYYNAEPVAQIAHDYISVAEAYCSTCKTVVVVSGGDSANAVTNGGATVDGQAISNGAAIVTAGSANAVTNRGVTIDGQLLTNGAIIATAGGGMTIWTNAQNAGGNAATNLNGLVVTGGQVRLVNTDVRISTPTLGDQPATKDYVDSGATAYTTNAVNRITYPDNSTNGGITILGLTDPAITNVLVDGAGKATPQFKPIPTVYWSFDNVPSAPTAWDDEFEAPLDIAVTETETGAWYIATYRTNHFLWVTNGALIVQSVGPSPTDSWSSASQALPAPPWRFVTKSRYHGISNLMYSGISIMETNGGRALQLVLARRSGAASTPELRVQSYTRPGAVQSIGIASIAAPIGDWPYFAIELQGTSIIDGTINFEASQNGREWLRVSTANSANPFGLGSTVTNWRRIGIDFDWSTNPSATNDFRQSFEWFRRSL